MPICSTLQGSFPPPPGVPAIMGSLLYTPMFIMAPGIWPTFPPLLELPAGCLKLRQITQLMKSRGKAGVLASTESLRKRAGAFSPIGPLRAGKWQQIWAGLTCSLPGTRCTQTSLLPECHTCVCPVALSGGIRQPCEFLLNDRFLSHTEYMDFQNLRKNKEWI